jgi:hypothetical protein
MEETMKAIFDPDKIERELSLLERELSLTETRTVLFNLVIFTHRGEEEKVEEQLLAPLLGKRAARIIQITLGCPGETSVSVSARCAPDRENKGVCFQEILIEDGQDGAGTAPGSWSAFLIRDIPVYVVWRTDLRTPGNQPGPLAFAREQADKFFLDGEYLLKNCHLSLEEFREGVLREFIQHSVQVTDFSWERMRPLRIFTAQVFDQPNLMDMIPHIESLTVEGPSELSRWLYASWFITVLGEEGKRVEVHSMEGKMYRIRIQFRDFPSVLVLEHQPGDIGVAVCGKEEVLVKPLKFPTDGEILLEQVDVPISDPLYAKALLGYQLIT